MRPPPRPPSRGNRWALGGTLFAVAAAATLLASPGTRDDDRFGHERHARLFPLCTTCHGGAIEPDSSIWPAPAGCVNCHDGVIEERIDWRPRDGPRATNLRFNHQAHAREARERDPADSALAPRCGACHTEAGAPRMTVRHAVVGSCLDCHELGPIHLAVPDSACGGCHLPLVDATLLTRADVAEFPEPPSHEQLDFALDGHGRLARAGGERVTVAASCATCHARNFCITCHVNAPEVPAIQALGVDERSLAHGSVLPIPASHSKPGFLSGHGQEATRAPTSCAACHAQESCATCHVGSPPRVVTRLASAGPGRGRGALLEREPPANHTTEFMDDRHGPDGNARPSSCEGCHVRPQCLDCHRPSPARGAGYHPEGFLSRHPAPAYSRDATCSDCHNPAQFCQSCHRQAGMTALGRLGPGGFHDAKGAFLVGHGRAARQSLETCASCHAERDCTACHSAVGGGFGFNPHGPGFNPDRMRRKNPSVCVACHGVGVPR